MGLEEDEDCVVYGSRLLLEEPGRRKGKLPVQQGHTRRVAPSQQEVTDAEGRRRFHGAFTGGFSAGYYNTVGSKEGWTPSTFFSSRNRRAEKQQQAVDDFLDEDEKEELKLKGLVPNSEYDALGSTAVELASRNASNEIKLWSSVVPGLVPDEMISASQSIGFKLLSKMGWQPEIVEEDRSTFPAAVSNRRGLGVGTLKSDRGNQTKIITAQEVPSSTGLSKKEDCLPSFTAATSLSQPTQQLRFPRPEIPVDFKATHILPAPLDTEQYLSGQEPPETPSPDPKTTKAINGVAAFVARSGPKFEETLKQKHLKSPQFPFLFEGCVGHEFYLRRLWEEQRNLSMQGKKQILSRSDNNRVELVGDNRGRILGDISLPRTEIVLASTNSKEESSSLERSEALSELTAHLTTRFTTGASDTRLTRVEEINHPSVLKHSSDASDLLQITRRVEAPWRPAALLCKRFNIPDPYVGKETVLPKARIKTEPLTLLASLSGTGKEPSFNVAKVQPSTSATNASINEDTRDTVVSEDSIDLYKAIFSDDEDEDEDQRGRQISGGKPVLDPKDAAGEFLESLGKELGLKV